MIQLQYEAIDAAGLMNQVIRKDCGAVVLFLGTVREITHGQKTQALTYEAYPAMAEAELVKIESAARARWPIGELMIVHRLGKLELMECSVAIAVSTPHRVDAFAAAQWIMEQIKVMVPIWKMDHHTDGPSVWIHPVPFDAGAP